VPLRLHTEDGEVLVARVLHFDDAELVYVPVESSRPERYAVCDSTGFTIPLRSIRRAQILRGRPRPLRQRPS
jgi:hypothetical protein